MEVIDQLSVHLEKRPDNLIKAKKEGQKIVGYLPGGFLPEELVLAAGAVPVCLLRVGILPWSSSPVNIYAVGLTLFTVAR